MGINETNSALQRCWAKSVNNATYFAPDVILPILWDRNFAYKDHLFLKSYLSHRPISIQIKVF
jgi:hypothetical protein